MNYTERIDGFQIRDITYLPGYGPEQPERCFDIVKWQQFDEPRTMTDFTTGKPKTFTESCYSVAILEWNQREEDFEFRSVGMRWLEAEPTAAVCNLIKAFARFKREEYRGLDEDD